MEGERVVKSEILWDLVALSFFISFAGAYVTTTIFCHANSCRHRSSKFMWIGVASLTFGLTSIWSMHFIALMAVRIDAPISFDIPLTIFSAFVAVLFTFCGFISATISVKVSHFRRKRLYKARADQDGHEQDEEQALLGIHDSDNDSELQHRRPTASSPSFLAPSTSLDDPHERTRERSRKFSETTVNSAYSPRGGDQSPLPLASPTKLSDQGTGPPKAHSSNNFVSKADFINAWKGFSNTTSNSDSAVSPSGLSLGTSNDFKFPRKRHDNAFSSIKHFLIDCLAVDRVIQAAIWAAAIVGMHYSGMAAFKIKDGYIRWNWFIVVLSYFIAWAVCLVATVFMPRMELDIKRQLAFSLGAASGVCCMHYVGASAATAYTTAPVSHDDNFGPIPNVVVGFALASCFICSTVLSHAATQSRNKLAESMLTKKKLWAVMARNEAMEATNKLQTSFISIASHELRTPLHSVVGYTDLLARTNLTSEQHLYVENVRRACHSLSLICSDVLDFSKLQKARVESQARPTLINIRAALENLARMTEDRGPRAQELGGVELIVDVDPNVPLKLFLDETYLTRILMNLLSNALKFSMTGYVRLSVSAEEVKETPVSSPVSPSATFRLGRTSNSPVLNGLPNSSKLQHTESRQTMTPSGVSIGDLTFKVEDTGMGIPKMFLDTLFQPFTQADTSLTRTRGGTGLGLAICKSLVERCGGNIKCESIERQGTTFVATLPLVPNTDTPKISQNSSPVSPISPSASFPRRIAIYCEHPRTRTALSEMWQKRNYNIVTLPTLAPASSTNLPVDVIWVDLPTLRKTPQLKTLAMKTASTIQFLVPYSEDSELSTFADMISTPNVIPFKRPIIAHFLEELLRNPAQVLKLKSVHIVPKTVRFREGSILQDTSPDTLQIPVLTELKRPHSPPRSNSAPIADAATMNKVEKSTKGRILLVEDNLVNQKLGERILRTLGYTAVIADNGLIALDRIKAEHSTIDLVLMDLQMPVMSGRESTIAIREWEAATSLPQLPVVGLSANVGAAIEEDCLAVGFTSFLPKPIDLSHLETILKYHIKAS